MSGRFFLAGFRAGHDVVAAARAARNAGYRVQDIYTPFPLHGMDEAMGLRPSRLSYVCLACGLVGAIVALWFQHWTSATDWPLNVGGKPFNSMPAFIPVAFELTVLLAGLGTVAALLLRCRLFPGRTAVTPHKRVTDDLAVLAIEQVDAMFDVEQARELFLGFGAVWMAEEVDGHLIEVPVVIAEPDHPRPAVRHPDDREPEARPAVLRRRPRRKHASARA